MQHDRHLIPWLSARFNITVSQSLFSDVGGCRYHAYKGDYDLDIPSVFGPTIFATAVEYAACYDGATFDRLVEIETGERPAIEQFKELVGV